MIFKCNNCGGNVVYDPAKKKMVCPHCESEESQSIVAEENRMQCVNCGAPLEPDDITSAMKCPNCGSYHVFEEMVSGEYKPHLILPFMISKEEAAENLKKEFKKRVFTPSGFLSHASISKMEGAYIPFFLYDYDSNAELSATGTKVRSWTEGNYRYTETSYYQVERELDIDFNRIPVDASKEMDNEVMDLLEPYDYKALLDFNEKYMSGFYGEIYSEDLGEVGKRAETKANRASEALLRDSVSGYSTLMNEVKHIDLHEKNREYALLPVWVYDFEFRGQKLRFHVNGQTGKVIGVTPVDKKKVVLYSASVFGICAVIGMLTNVILSVFL